METQRHSIGSGRQHRSWFAVAAILVAVLTGCASTPQPHVTAKVIYQDPSGVAAEIATEWR